MFSYDAALVCAVKKQPQTVPDVIATMQAIDSTCSDGDGLKWFNWLYLNVTEAVAARIAQKGFTDPVWLAQLDVIFAGFYFGALESALTGGPAPDCWQALLECRNRPSIARIQFALSGINAHINHDLAAAIVATCETSGIAPTRSCPQYADYTALNTTLDSLIDEAKHKLNVRLLGDPLPPASHIENTIAAWSVRVAREAAWQNAGLLWFLRSSPVLSANFLSTLDGLTSLAGRALLVPDISSPASTLLN